MLESGNRYRDIYVVKGRDPDFVSRVSIWGLQAISELKILSFKLRHKSDEFSGKFHHELERNINIIS